MSKITAALIVALAAAGCGTYSGWSEGRQLGARPRRGARAAPAEHVLARRAIAAARAELFSEMAKIPADDVFCAVAPDAPWGKALMGMLALEKLTAANPLPSAGRLARLSKLAPGEILFTRISTAETIILKAFWRDWDKLKVSSEPGLAARLGSMSRRDLFPMRQNLPRFPWPKGPKVFVGFEDGPGIMY